MKPVASSFKETDTIDGEEVKFSISPANSAWIMRSMADLYSNRELACVREYSTNAYDSNKEYALANGIDIAPIQVTLPSVMNPYFEIKDSGVGMSLKELTEVYTQFGESTKRDSDEFNGMLGFGSKSAIAYTNTFTITSVKNGYKNIGVITRREDAMGGYLVTLKIVVENMPTSDYSGVTVQIPVHNWRQFDQVARDFYRFWMPGSVLLNGKEPKWEVGDKIDKDLYINLQAGTSYVVMGNVAYRIENSRALFPSGMNEISFVAYVPLGTVEFTPSREDLKYSEHTKNNLKKIVNDFITSAVDNAKKEIASASTHYEAYKYWTKWKNTIGASQVDSLTFKGDKLADHFNITGSAYSPNRTRYNTEYIYNNKWSVERSPRTLIVTNFTPQNISAAHKTKMKAYIAHIGKALTDYSWVIFTAESKVASPWVDPANVVEWEKVKRDTPVVKKPRVQNVAWGRKAGSFDVVSRKGRKDEQDVPNSTNLFYIMTKEYNVSENLDSLLEQFKMDDIVVILPANRKDKFLRFYPHAKPIMDELKKKLNLDGPSLLSADAKKYLSIYHNDIFVITTLDETKIDDPVLVDYIRVAKIGEDKLTKDYVEAKRLAKSVGKLDDFKKHRWERTYDRTHKVLADYPWISSRYLASGKEKNHACVYINAIYKARKDGLNV